MLCGVQEAAIRRTRADNLSTNEETQAAKPGALALLVGRDRKTSIIRLEPGAEFHTHRGTIAHDDLIGSPWGTQSSTHLGETLLLLRPSTDDLVRNLKRTTQIVYPKDAGYILMKMSIAPGRRVIEAGTGSGGLTLVLAQAVRPDGCVISYDTRPEVQQLARKNLQQLGLADAVTFKERDVAEGFDERGVDALFFDLPNPWDYLDQAHAALAGGGFLGSILPTANQVVNLVAALENADFGLVEVEELLLRPYRTASARLRPEDRLTPHTGYLAFGRRLVPTEEQDYGKPKARGDRCAEANGAEYRRDGAGSV
jgi:tRNA (adenine57-N1/adenine58-N1)-methyltransferase